MLINRNTKISVIIKHNMEAIASIASINPHFKKLKNPVLRALLAPRVNLAEASKIGKCSVEDLFEKLKLIGFKIDESEKNIPENKANILIEQEIVPTKTIDVRPIIQKAEDPFLLIMNAVKDLKTSETLEIINSFEPIPLIRILSKKGFLCSTVQKRENLYSTYFKSNADNSLNINSSSIIELNQEDFNLEDLKSKDKQTEIDVRDLEMPLPMLTILEQLEQLPKKFVLKVYHKKVPQFLIPELEERDFIMKYYIKTDEEVLLLISK